MSVQLCYIARWAIKYSDGDTRWKCIVYPKFKRVQKRTQSPMAAQVKTTLVHTMDYKRERFRPIRQTACTHCPKDTQFNGSEILGAHGPKLPLVCPGFKVAMAIGTD